MNQPWTINTGDPLHSRALAHSRAPLFTQPCPYCSYSRAPLFTQPCPIVHTAVPHCSHSRAPGEQWARLCVFTLQGCVQSARLCRGSPVINTTITKQGTTKHEHILWTIQYVSRGQPQSKHIGNKNAFSIGMIKNIRNAWFKHRAEIPEISNTRSIAKFDGISLFWMIVFHQRKRVRSRRTDDYNGRVLNINENISFLLSFTYFGYREGLLISCEKCLISQTGIFI